MVTEWMKGKLNDQRTEIKINAMAEGFGLPKVKMHCSVLAEDAIKAAITDYKSKQGKA